MFGWEFPPSYFRRAGYSLLWTDKRVEPDRRLEVLFVVPKAYGDEDQSRLSLIDAGEVP